MHSHLCLHHAKGVWCLSYWKTGEIPLGEQSWSLMDFNSIRPSEIHTFIPPEWPYLCLFVCKWHFPAWFFRREKFKVHKMSPYSSTLSSKLLRKWRWKSNLNHLNILYNLIENHRWFVDTAILILFNEWNLCRSQI